MRKSENQTTARIKAGTNVVSRADAEVDTLTPSSLRVDVPGDWLPPLADPMLGSLPWS